METRDRERIAANLVSLVASTNLNSQLEQTLVGNGVFSQKMLAVIKREGDEDAVKQRLYTDVQKRGPKAFQRLIEALLASGNLEATRILSPQSEELSANRNAKVWNEPNYGGDKTPPGYVPALPRDDRIPLEVKVVEAKTFKEAPNAYPCRRRPRGLALIIDNEEFVNDTLPKREGTLADSNNLQTLFEQLGFKVRVERNLNYTAMYNEVYNFSREGDHAKADVCILAVLSHGDQGLVYTSDQRKISVEWIMSNFNNEYCPSLKGKPKLFFFQACRGDEEDYGYIPKIELSEGSTTTSDAQAIPQGDMPQSRLSGVRKEAKWGDMLIAYATIPGYVANRNVYRGTWYIECLCDVFMNHAHNTDVRDMLDMLSERLANYESELGTKQTCSYEVRHFYKKLFFNPGLNKDEA